MVDSKMSNSWPVLRFADIAANITERVDEPSQSRLDYYVGLGHLDSDTIRISRWGSPTDVEATKLRFYPGDVIYARRRAYQRKLGVAVWDGICSAHALVLRARPDVCLPEFLPYFLQSDQFHQRALDISVGSLSPTINWKTLAVQQFTVPPLAEQRVIVQLVGAADSVADGYAATLRAIGDVRDAMAASLSRADDVVALADVAEVQYGVTVGPRRRSLATELPYLRVANVQRGRVDLAEVKTVGAEDTDVVRYQLEPNDLLVVEGHADRTEVGRAAIWTCTAGVMLHQNHVIRVRCTDAARPRVLLELLNSRKGRRYFSAQARNTSGLNTVNSTTVKSFPVPKLDLQTQLRAESTLLELDRVAALASDARAHALKLRQGLLARLIEAT